MDFQVVPIPLGGETQNVLIFADILIFDLVLIFFLIFAAWRLWRNNLPTGRLFQLHRKGSFTLARGNQAKYISQKSKHRKSKNSVSPSKRQNVISNNSGGAPWRPGEFFFLLRVGSPFGDALGRQRWSTKPCPVIPPTKSAT